MLTNIQFLLLVASLTLCNTIIPIVSGLLVARFGTTKSSLVTTTIILVEMIILTIANCIGKVGFMIYIYILLLLVLCIQIRRNLIIIKIIIITLGIIFCINFGRTIIFNTTINVPHTIFCSDIYMFHFLDNEHNICISFEIC